MYLVLLVPLNYSNPPLHSAAHNILSCPYLAARVVSHSSSPCNKCRSDMQPGVIVVTIKDPPIGRHISETRTSEQRVWDPVYIKSSLPIPS